MISCSVLICANGSVRETSATCFLILVGLKFIAVNVILVGLGVRLPLLGQIFLREDGRHRTDRNTCTAVNALSGIDVELRHFIERRASIVIGSVFRRMDTIHRAHIYTGSVFRPETAIGNDVGHQSPPMHGPYQPSKGVGSAAYKPSVKSENHPADPVSNPATQPDASSITPTEERGLEDLAILTSSKTHHIDCVTPSAPMSIPAT